MNVTFLKSLFDVIPTGFKVCQLFRYQNFIPNGIYKICFISKKIYYKILIITISLFLYNCNKHEINRISETDNRKIIIEDFDRFYDKFHKDSVFQMSSIKFPLDGIKFDSGKEMKWSKNNWSMLKTRIFDVDTSEFKIQYIKNNDSFYQKFWIENSGFWGEYQFRLIENKWYLVYAVDHNL